MPLLSGTRVGPYEILALIGSGGMGEVYRARDPQLDREVAIKVLPNFSDGSDRLRRFEQEARATAALNHPNIVAVFQFGAYEGAPYLVSELLDGETLREQIRRGGHLSVRKTTDFGVQIARGLAAAHEKGIVHRDLKPENLFVSRDDRVKILDFGLAKFAQRRAIAALDDTTQTQVQPQSTEPGTIMGTVGYMSPEQVRGQNADHRTDIFSFGAILYELLAGNRAFQKATSAETMSAILNDEPPELSQLSPNLPPAFARIVRRCLEKNPEHRFQSASDLAFALEALSDSGSGSASSPVTAAAGRTWKWIAAAGTAAALLVVTLIAWLRAPPATPEVRAVIQLTDDGEPKFDRLVTDGSRIYFNEGAPGSWRIAQVSVNGGQTAPVATRLVNPQITALSPDGSTLLALVGGFMDAAYSLWSIPLPAGEPRRVAAIMTQDATFFPDGHIAYVQGTQLFVTEKDGSNPRKLIELPQFITAPSVSPDAARIALTMWSGVLVYSRLLEINTANATHRELVKPTDDLQSPGRGTWTHDEKFLIFENSGIRSDLWTLQEKSGLLRRAAAPARLTNGPLSYAAPIPARSGNQIFVLGSKRRGELIRYDEKFHQFAPFLAGLSATDATFSHDGKWVAYRSYPDSTLWRSRTDGTDRLQLTFAPTVVWLPSISPDGTKVVYGTNERAVFVSSMDGGTPQKVTQDAIDASWSPDGSQLAITCWIPGKTGGDQVALELRIFDLQTGKTTPVPGSQGRIGAFWIDQHTLVAATQAGSAFLTVDLTTGKWTELTSGNFVNWILSPDSKYLYFTKGGADPSAQRLRLSDRKIETIASLKGLRRVIDPYSGTQVGITPEGSLLLTRDVGTQEIYALDVTWP
jgi:eukaryotic-like serine/threonine-protein kinase